MNTQHIRTRKMCLGFPVLTQKTYGLVYTLQHKYCRVRRATFGKKGISSDTLQLMTNTEQAIFSLSSREIALNS